MRILSVIPYWGPEFGGPFFNVANLTANIILNGHESSILTTSKTPEKYHDVYEWNVGQETINMPIAVGKRHENFFCFSADFSKLIRDHAEKNDVVFMHGLWRFPTAYAALHCRKIKKPYIYFSHAMLSRWSLGHKGLWKKFYLDLVERENLNRAAMLAVMTEEEAQSAKERGVTSETFLFSSAINREDINERMDDLIFSQSKSGGKFNILFLSRIHRKKGLIYLMAAMKELISKRQPVILIVAGPVEDRLYYDEILRFVNKNQLQKHISFLGPVKGAQKAAIFRSADMFVLPSFDEGVPLSVIEAMGYGLPVVITPGCKMNFIERGMGFVVNQDPGEIARAVMSVIENREIGVNMGRKGKEYVLENCVWDKKIKELLELTKNVTGVKI